MKIKVPISCLVLNLFSSMKQENNRYFTASLYKTQTGYKLCEVWLHLGWSFDIIWIEKFGAFSLDYKALKNALGVSPHTRSDDGKKLAEVISSHPV